MEKLIGSDTFGHCLVQIAFTLKYGWITGG